MANLMKRFVKEEEGLEFVEYALLSALIVVALVAGYTQLAGTVNTALTNAQNVFP